MIAGRDVTSFNGVLKELGGRKGFKRKGRVYQKAVGVYEYNQYIV